MIKLGYKIVRQRGKGKDKKFVSFNDGRVTYSLNDWAVPLPGDGPLTVLNSRKAARILLKAYRNSYQKYHIFRCLYEPTKGDTIWQAANKKSIKDLEDYCNKYPLCNPRIQLLPGSTRLAKCVLIF